MTETTLTAKEAIEQLHAFYVAAFPWVIGLGTLWGVYNWGTLRPNWALLRCLAIMLAGQVTIEAWEHAHAGEAWHGQPYVVLLLIHAVSARLVTIRPAGKLCSTMAGIFIAGVLLAVMAIAFEYTPERDLAFWQGNVILAVLQFVVIFGGATGERGRRFCIALGRGVTGIINRARAGRLA